MIPLRLSTEILDGAAWGILTPTTGATAAERRVFDGAGTDPPESGSSGSERKIRVGVSTVTHHADSSPEAQCQCPAVGHETGYDEDVTKFWPETYTADRVDKKSFAEFLGVVETFLSVLAPGLLARPLLEWAAAFRDQPIVLSDVEAYEAAHGNPFDWNL